MSDTAKPINRQCVSILIDQLAMLEELEKQAQKGTDTETLKLIQLEIHHTRQRLYEPTPHNPS